MQISLSMHIFDPSKKEKNSNYFENYIAKPFPSLYTRVSTNTGKKPRTKFRENLKNYQLIICNSRIRQYLE